MSNLEAVSAPNLCFDILRRQMYLPLVNGKPNYANIEEEITIGMLCGELGYVDQETVNLTFTVLDEILKTYNVIQ